MTLSIFAAILLAALLHALWNALAKRQAEGRVSVLLVSLCSGLFSRSGGTLYYQRRIA